MHEQRLKEDQSPGHGRAVGQWLICGCFHIETEATQVCFALKQKPKWVYTISSEWVSFTIVARLAFGYRQLLLNVIWLVILPLSTYSKLRHSLINIVFVSETLFGTLHFSPISETVFSHFRSTSWLLKPYNVSIEIRGELVKVSNKIKWRQI